MTIYHVVLINAYQLIKQLLQKKGEKERPNLHCNLKTSTPFEMVTYPDIKYYKFKSN